MTGFELREEIDHAGRKYFLQTSMLPQKGIIQSSFFRNGVPFDTTDVAIDGKAPAEALRRATKEAHLENKRRFLILLGVTDRVRQSDDPKPHLRVAQALARRHLLDEAIQEARHAIEKGNKDSLPHLIIGSCSFEAGKFDAAIKAVENGLAINPEYPDLHNLLGVIHLKQRRCRAAIDCFNRAIGLNLYYGEPYLNLARAFLLNTIIKEDYELARDLDTAFLGNLDRAVQLDPYLASNRVEEARSLFRGKEYELAYEALESAGGRSERGGIEDIVLDLYLMLLYDGENLREEDIEGHLESVRQIVDQNPTFADGHNSLGILYTAKCKIFMDRANKAFQKALEINGNYQKAQKNLRLSENDKQGIFILLKALLD